jgi:hypothetical protein
VEDTASFFQLLQQEFAPNYSLVLKRPTLNSLILYKIDGKKAPPKIVVSINKHKFYINNSSYTIP